MTNQTSDEEKVAEALWDFREAKRQALPPGRRHYKVESWEECAMKEFYLQEARVVLEALK